ncbi:MAG: endonuclease Q family protein [Candidatus Anstonellaceae archaeon]
MKVVADLHLHSKYSRATSAEMGLESLSEWAKIKGIDLLGSGDFTNPKWLDEIESKAICLDCGFLQYKDTRFCLSAEISCVYEQQAKMRKVHLVLLCPSIEVARQINESLAKYGNLLADGRPTLLLSAVELCEIVFEISQKNLIIPAHAWTPWFSVFGSKSGFDSLKECFAEYENKIYAIETGLSSDPAMNWRLSQLDRVQLLSNSDSHSPEKIGREATVFELDRLTYDELYEAIRYKEKRKIACTFEFYPEEGKYHFDGHRNCKVSFSPEETKKHGGICPVCRKPLTIGVLNRVEQLADRPEGFVPRNAVPFENLVPLKEIIAQAMGKNLISKSVEREYFHLVKIFGSELAALHAPYELIARHAGKRLAEGIKMVREGKVRKIAGFDGEYGQIIIFSQKKESQTTLEEF